MQDTATPRRGEKSSAELGVRKQLDEVGFKIPTRKLASDQPGALYAANRVGGNDMASSIIIVCGRHSPPPRQDPTTHVMSPILQGRKDPTKHASIVFSSNTTSLGLDTPITRPFDPDGDTMQHLLTDTATQFDEHTVENMPAYYECDIIVDFLGEHFLLEPRYGLLLTQAGTEHHLLLHNNICGRLVKMMEELLRANLPIAKRNILSTLCNISQHNMLQTWPGKRLQLGATTSRVVGLLGELAEFQARRLDFLMTTKAILLEVCENLYNPRRTATANYTPQLAHFLDLKPTVTWIQVALPEDLTHTPLQRAALYETFGPLGDINEIFLFKPRPEGFIIFNGNLHFPNINGIMTPQRTRIAIINPQHPLAPTCAATSPHYPTRRPAIGSAVTLFDKQREAVVVAIEQKYWPEEWVYVIRIEEWGKLPKILYSILQRNGLQSADNPCRIRPTARQPADGDVAFFFNSFERQTQVNVIQQSSPGLYETIRLVHPPAPLSPRAIIQYIPGHRLFQHNEPSSMGRHSDQIRFWPTDQLDPTPKPETSREQNPTEAGPRTALTEVVTDQESHKPSAPPNLTPLVSMNPNEVSSPKRGRPTLAKRGLPDGHDDMVVIPKKRRNRGALVPKILVQWRNITIPCIYSDRLTPALLIETIRLSPHTRQDTLAKATLTPPNNLSATLHLHATFRSQGIFAGDIVNLVTRHARVYDPFGVRHFVAYRDEDTIQYFLGVLKETSPIPFLCELVVYHDGFPLVPALRVQDCNLPQEPSLHVRFRSHLDTYPLKEPGCTESATAAGNAPGEIPPHIVTGPQEHPQQTHEPKHSPGDKGMHLPSIPSQVFVTDSGGRTHVLLFRPGDSIATNLLRCSTQLPLPPFADLYIRSGQKTLKLECTGHENGLHHEPRLEIVLRCKGGMRGGVYGSSRDKGRGQRASAGSSKDWGGGQITTEDNRTSPVKIERGRGRGARGSDRRPTLVHAQPQEDLNEFDRYALMIARRQTLQTSTSLLCQEFWETSRISPGYGPPPPAAAHENSRQEEVPETPRRPPPSEFSARPAPPPSKKKIRKATARQLQVDEQPSPLAQDSHMMGHHDNAEEPGFPTSGGSSPAAIPGAEGTMLLGPRNERPDQDICDPPEMRRSLPSPELDSSIIPPSNAMRSQEPVHTSGNTPTIPQEGPTEPLTQLGSDYTCAPADKLATGPLSTIGRTPNGSGKEMSLKVSTRSNSRKHKPLPPQEGCLMTELPSYAAPDYSTLLTDMEEWSHLCSTPPWPMSEFHLNALGVPCRQTNPGPSHRHLAARTRVTGDKYGQH